MPIFYNPNRKKGLFFIPYGATGGERLAIEYSAARFCEDGTDPIPGITGETGGTFSSTTGLVFISTSTGQVDLSGSDVGSYVVTYTAPSSETATTSITIDSIPVVSAGSDVAICNGENTVLTATGATTYLWSTGETTASITVNPTTTTSFTVTGYNGACSATDSVQVTVNALPTVEITGTLTYCAGGSTTLTATAGLSSYLWSTGATTQAITVSTTGSYTVTGTDSNGCSATSGASTVTELPLDSATVTYSSSAYCQMPTGATAVDRYYPLYTSQADANAASSDGSSHSHSLTGGTYYMPNSGVIIYHGTYSLTTPAPTITGESGTFSESTGNLSIDSSTGVINVNSSTAGTYTVVYTTNGSCPNTINNTITINALDGATFGYSASSLPQTGTASLTTTPTTSGGVYSAYPSGLSINSSTGEINLAASTIQSYKIFYVTSGTCPNSSTFDLAVTASGLSNNHSFSFDGINDYIDTGFNGLNGLSQATVSFWLKSSNVNQNGHMFGNLTSNSGLAMQFYTNNTAYIYINNETKTFTTSSYFSNNTWHNFILVFDGSLGTNDRLKAYVDGNLITFSSVSSTTLLTSTNNFLLGHAPGGAYFNGSIDEVGIWNTTLTSTQVQSIYDATGTNTTSDLSTIEPSNLKYWNRMGD